jgi:hypothetical protein
MAVTAVGRGSWMRWRPTWLAWGLWMLNLAGLVVLVWLDQLLGQTNRPELVVLNPTAFAPVLGAVSTATVGAVVASRRPRHPVGWLLLALGLSLTAAGVTLATTNYGVAHAAPAAGRVARYVPATIVVAMACNGLTLLLTPTGHLPSPGWRWWAGIIAATPVVLLGVVTLSPGPGDRLIEAVDSPLDLRALDGGLLIAYQAASAVIIIAFVGAAGSLVGRFRRARGVERQQLRWVALATVLIALLAVVNLAALALAPMPWRRWWAASTRRSWRWASARPSCATGCTTWTASSAAPWPSGCSPCCWAAATPWSCSGSASSWAETPLWWSPGRPWPWPRCSSRPAAASRPWSTAASTDAATTPPGSSRTSVPACATKSTSTPSPLTCWP